MIFILIAPFLQTEWKLKLKAFFKNKTYFAITGIFLLFFISGLWSENTDYFLNRSRIKLPILFMPLAFFMMPKISLDLIKAIMYFFIGLIITSAIWSSGMYLTDLEHYTKIYGKGQIIPTPIHHVRYSIMVSIAMGMCIYWLFFSQKLNTKRELAINNKLYKSLVFFKKQKVEFILLIGISLFLLVYQHILAVRSGLMTMYVILLCAGFFFIRKKKSPKLIIGMVFTFAVGSVLAYKYVPTIKHKIGYMKYSLDLFKKKENIRHLSDSRRLGSIYAGIQLIKENPLYGVGIGDIMDETNDYLKKHYPQLTNLELLPHNQYILSGTALGVIGMTLFIIFSLMPLFHFNGYKDFFLLSTQLIFYSSFMVEHTIESQIGVALYIYITLLAMKSRESQLEYSMS